MKNHRRFIFSSNILFVLISIAGSFSVQAQSKNSVVLSEDDVSYTLTNKSVTAKVSKNSGDLISLRYKGLQLLESGSGHPYAYWSHAPSRKSKIVDAVTIDPAKNNGERGEVSVKGFYQPGINLGEGPGGSTACDIEIRYSLGRDDSGIYTYSILTHKADYPATQIGEARFGAKLNPQIFDWLSIDAKRNKLMEKPEDWDKGTQLNMKEARLLNIGIYKGRVSHKYDYSAIQYDIPAFGWTSTTAKIGLWFVNPTIEYLSGGATKVELTGHLDNNEGAAPTLLNYWRGSHYGGSSLVIKEGENWTKTVGPFLIYVNSANDPQAMWQDALAQADKESKKWAYEWVSGVDYPKNNERSTVSGQLILDDKGNPNAKMSNLLVGLSAPDYEAQGFRGRTETVSWQTDAKTYEFWTRGAADGKFTISKVRPGKYTLHAIAAGVLGEFAQTEVTIEAGKPLNLGKLDWKPVRYGRQIWEIGIPNRSAEEFKHGDHYWQWGLYTLYPKEFPNDVNFTIGKSDYRIDWNYAEVPRLTEDNGKGGGQTTATTWTINFNLLNSPRGKAILRLAIASNSARSLTVAVNDKDAGEVAQMPDTATIRRDGIRGLWFERNVNFDASILKQGANTIKLTVPAGNAFSGVQYDYLRLELDETAK
ncbi:MAG: polysaccharide lyase family protein [Acidobacteriota bacterium]|nr:polysaccharide lyase family protein [Acidobacteriota bacterium]